MSDAVPATRYRPPATPIVWLMRLAALAALALSAMLLYESARGSGLPGCGQGTGCDEVLNSPWSRIRHVPVALPAVNIYAVMFVAMFFLLRRTAWALLLIVASAAIVAAGWFVYVQLAHVGAVCKYCMSVHVCGTAAGLLVLIHAPVGRLRLLPDDPPDRVMIPAPAAVTLALVGALGVAAAATIQIVRPAPSTRVTLLEGELALDLRAFPMLGPADAPVIVAAMYDYTCPHCRRLEQMLREARQYYGAQLAVVALPVPLNSACNPVVRFTEPMHADACDLARLAVAVWRADPARFEAMHDWLFDHQHEITVAQAEAHARQLVGEAALQRHLDDPAIAERFGAAGELFERLGGGLPKLLTETIQVDGRPDDTQELLRLLEYYTPLRPPRD